MKNIMRIGTFVIALTLLGSLATAASTSKRASKYFTVAGTVLEINQADRTLLVADRASNQRYLIEVPDGATFKIVFGKYSQMREPGFSDVSVRERIEIRCVRGDTEHLALLDKKLNAMPVIAVTTAQ